MREEGKEFAVERRSTVGTISKNQEKLFILTITNNVEFTALPFFWGPTKILKVLDRWKRVLIFSKSYYMHALLN